MYLPEKFQDRSYVEWNHLVRGIVVIWEMAQMLGLDRYLEERLRAEDGHLVAERLGRLGNDHSLLARLFRNGYRELAQSDDRAILCPLGILSDLSLTGPEPLRPMQEDLRYALDSLPTS